MNSHNNPKKRRLSGHEDAPVVVTQDPSSTASAAYSPPVYFTEPYTGIPSTSYDHEPKHHVGERASVSSPQPWTLPPAQVATFAYDGSPHSQLLPEYPVLQPTQAQPSTRREEMTYQMASPVQKHAGRPDRQGEQRANDHVMATHDMNYRQRTYMNHGDSVSQYGQGTRFLPLEEDGSHAVQQSHGNLDIVSNNQRPPPAKRGPFKNNSDRERTAETRRIGSCIRCRMQRIRCEINPDDKAGTCLTCTKVSNAKVWRLPCLRYKITDVRLFKPGQVKGHEWTRRWTEGIADDISQWASSETRMVCVTEGYTQRPVRLRVRKFIPQEGDALERSWVHNGVRRSVEVPPYAIVNLDEAKSTYTDHIGAGLKECCRRVVTTKDKLIGGTYGLALSVMMDESTDPKAADLLRKAFRLWMAIRMTTKSTFIVGDERLDMAPDIMDETSPLQGHIPLPPVMGAQIELVLIHQLQSKWRREMLDGLQVMTQSNNHSTWLTIYLVTFILLHNVSLLCQHDAGYARKHGIKARFAREDMVREYQLGIYPFSVECKDQDLSTLAKLDATKIKFVQRTRAIVEEQRKHWQKTRQSNDYEHDLYFISQLYEENWAPQPPMV
ncbi:hypothetical protein JX266_006626 [Neoarthrinium moseri]|nr:hypothetical protein JX266_006626 [Neoarthrinium moseri]